MTRRPGPALPDPAEAPAAPRTPSASTVGRARGVASRHPRVREYRDRWISASLADSRTCYAHWPRPTAIVSDGAYGVLGFEGDTSDHLGLPAWYEPHIAAWSRAATPQTTLWFWNSEIGWAAVHPVLERHGWRYVNANLWNKGKGHIAGNVNTASIRRFPVVSEVCVQYVLGARVDGLELREWLHREWIRSGLPLKKANEACGVRDAASRKYLNRGHLWYFPPPRMFERLQAYANRRGDPAGRPYFCLGGRKPGTADEWAGMRAKFHCPHGFTNVWDRPALRGPERFTVKGRSARALHLNQKPLDLMSMIIAASSDAGDVVWEPFGGLLSASIAARRLKRRAFAAEIDPTYFHYGLQRLGTEAGRP